MSAFLWPATRPAVTARPGAFARWLGAPFGLIARHAARRDAIAWLRELDDAALRDIGIARCEIERAVCGLIHPVSPLTAIMDASRKEPAPWN